MINDSNKENTKKSPEKSDKTTTKLDYYYEEFEKHIVYFFANNCLKLRINCLKRLYYLKL